MELKIIISNKLKGGEIALLYVSLRAYNYYLFAYLLSWTLTYTCKYIIVHQVASLHTQSRIVITFTWTWCLCNVSPSMTKERWGNYFTKRPRLYTTPFSRYCLYRIVYMNPWCIIYSLDYQVMFGCVGVINHCFLRINFPNFRKVMSLILLESICNLNSDSIVPIILVC